MTSEDKIYIRGARVHNLKNINLEIPRNKLVVVTGLSGSGKSSLAFDTLYAEGQRRYVESLSAYARQFLEQLQKPDVDHIEGISPAISIEQRSASANPRSTVATTTEIYDYLRLLFARIGHPRCHECGRDIRGQSAEEIIEAIMKHADGRSVAILAPVVRGRKGEYHTLLQEIKRSGFVRVRINGSLMELSKEIVLDKKLRHTIEVVIDRVQLMPENKERIADSVETALKVGSGLVIVAPYEKEKGEPGGSREMSQELLFSEIYACPECGISLEELEPRMFSFNSPYGACVVCGGLGNKMEIDPELLVSDPSKSIREGAIQAWRRGGKRIILYYRRLLREVAREYDFDLETPFKKLPKKIKNIILYGDGEWFEGVIPNLERRFNQTDSDFVKSEINKYMSVLPCPTCGGRRLRKESLSVFINDLSIADIAALSVKRALAFFGELRLEKSELAIARQIIKEIKSRLTFMANIGLDYLTLDRISATLSGGEAQRIRLATQIGAGLVGVLYILDEPSIGLHQRDNSRLLATLKKLRDLGNTLLVVEHDEATIRNADYIIDLGPGAGKHGGEVVVSGTLHDVVKTKNSLTGSYLRGELVIPVPQKRRPFAKRKRLCVRGAEEHNLKNIDVCFPLGVFICVTGVSGSGKSTLVDEILYRSLAHSLYGSRVKPGKHRGLEGAGHVDKVIVIDQSPIGRTPRSNPATYTGLFSFIRELFSRLPEARVRGYRPGRFSFNVKGGRCEACTGDGLKRIEMHFLPDVYVTCDVCKGKRFNTQTLQVCYKGKSIADVLHMTVEEARDLFSAIPKIKKKLDTMFDVGLGYVELGQSATTLSGGEAQRVKLAAELSKKGTGNTFYILDEPTTGLHFADIEKLLQVLHSLVDLGNTVLVIEHNLDVIKTADYIIDLGPEGGEEGGCVVAAGAPEDIIKVSNSYTAKYLKDVL
ncbi:MAG: excinuclease ABC subunit UvrA [Candidatus Omnitrophica bacterium]|nr:excinuclease ABC subunit UvrA [Candidatus Omnitrophota bacterium]